MCGLGRFVPLTGLFVAVVMLSQCQVIGGFAGYEVVEPALGGGGGGGGHGGASSCDLMSVPSPPVEGASGGGGHGGADDVTFALAVRKVNVGETEELSRGFDLDGACTCGDEACDCASVVACRRPAVVRDDLWLQCDDEGGVDANSAKLFGGLQAFQTPISSAAVSLAIESGQGTVMFDVRNYNGKANDDEVTVGVYTAGRFLDAECHGSGGPKWEGEDAWPIDVTSVFNELPACGLPPSPAVFDVLAYVVEGKLVTRLSQVRFYIEVPGSPLQVKVDDVIAVVPLVRDDTGKWTTTGASLAGRWRVRDIFDAVGALDELSPAELCDTSLVSVQDAVCRAADAATHSDPTASCDAVSFLAEFDAVEAKFGNTVELPVIESCPELRDLDCETDVQ